VSFENANENAGTQAHIAAWREAHYSDAGVQNYEQEVTTPLIKDLDDLMEDPLWDQQVTYRPDFVRTICSASAIEILGERMGAFLKTNISLRHERYWNPSNAFNESYLLQIGASDNHSAHGHEVYTTWLAIRRYARYDSFSLLSSTALRWAVVGSEGRVKVEDAADWTGVVNYDLEQISADLNAFGHLLRSNVSRMYRDIYGTGEGRQS